MCQINTDPMMFQTATLDVNVPPDIGLRNMVLAKESPLETLYYLPSKSANVNIFYELFPTHFSTNFTHTL